MQIEIGKDDPLLRILPRGVFLARHKHGSLRVVAPCYMSNGMYNVLDIEGRGCGAIGAVYRADHKTILQDYAPVDATVSFKNEYP